MDFFSLNLHHFVDGLLAQVPQPATEVDLLKQQIEIWKSTSAQQSADFAEKLKFITDDNKNLNDRFSQFVTIVNAVLGLFGFLAVFGTAIGGYLFGKSLSEAKSLIRQQVEAQIGEQVRHAVNAEIEVVRRTLGRERVIGAVTVDYYSPSSGGEPEECQLLRDRGFREVRFWNQSMPANVRFWDVVVLDLVSHGVLSERDSGDEREQKFDQAIAQLQQRVHPSTVIVIYVVPHVKLEKVQAIAKHYVSANMAIRLVGAAADGAYVAHAQRNAASL